MKDIVATVLFESLIKKGWVAARLEVEVEGRRDPGWRVGRTREKAEGEGGWGRNTKHAQIHEPCSHGI